MSFLLFDYPLAFDSLLATYFLFGYLTIFWLFHCFCGLLTVFLAIGLCFGYLTVLVAN